MHACEQICQHDPSALYRRWLKRHYARLMRRLARIDPEAAPVRRRYRGYSL